MSRHPILRLLPPAVLLLTAMAASGPLQAQPDTLEAVRTALRQLAGSAPIATTLERAVTSERKDRPLEAGRVELEVAAGRDGTSIRYPADLLAQLQTERADPDPEKARPARRTLENFDVTDVADLLHAAPALLSDLDGATLKADTESTYDGRPARRLELELVLQVSKADRKWLKSGSRSMTLWITPEGIPLADEVESAYTVGLLIFTFDATDTRRRAFTQIGDRLAVVRRLTRFEGAGLGESQHVTSETTLRLGNGS